MFSMASKTMSAAARRAVLVSSGTGNLLAASARQEGRPTRTLLASPSSPQFFPISLTSQDVSKQAVVMRVASLRSRKYVVYVAPARAAVMLKARTRLMLLDIQDAGLKMQKENEAREVVKKARAQVFRQLRKAHEKRKKNRTISRKMSPWIAVRNYSVCGYREINGQLRRGCRMSQEVKTQVSLILSAMTKRVRLPVYRGTVYRGARLPPYLMDKLRPGTTFYDRGFTSTTKVEKVAFLSEEGAVKFIIESKTGVYISSVAAQKEHEAEVLFRPGTKFEIISVARSNARLLVTMKELF
jgi:hypothetical protein